MQTTGWPPGMLQDDSRELSRWLSTRLGARYQIQRNNMQTNQTPEALAEEISRLFEAHIDAEDTDVALHYLQQAHNAIDRLRDMAARGAKDAERLVPVRDIQMVIALMGEAAAVFEALGPDVLEKQPMWRWLLTDELGGAVLIMQDHLAAIAATKRGEV